MGWIGIGGGMAGGGLMNVVFPILCALLPSLPKTMFPILCAELPSEQNVMVPTVLHETCAQALADASTKVSAASFFIANLLAT